MEIEIKTILIENSYLVKSLVIFNQYKENLVNYVTSCTKFSNGLIINNNGLLQSKFRGITFK